VWDALNQYFENEASHSVNRDEAAAEEAAALTLALWSAGIKYIVAMPEWGCPHAGFLWCANMDLGTMNFSELEELDMPPNMVIASRMPSRASALHQSVDFGSTRAHDHRS